MTLPPMTLPPITDALIQVCQDKKGESIVAYNVSGRSALTDVMVLVTATNSIHLKALAQELTQKTPSIINENPQNAHDYFTVPKVTGTHESGWIAVDINSVVFHLMTGEMRESFRLDALFESSANAVVHF